MDKNKVEAATENLEYVVGVLDIFSPGSFDTYQEWEVFAGAYGRLLVILRQLREVVK